MLPFPFKTNPIQPSWVPAVDYMRPYNLIAFSRRLYELFHLLDKVKQHTVLSSWFCLTIASAALPLSPFPVCLSTYDMLAEIERVTKSNHEFGFNNTKIRYQFRKVFSKCNY